jgi:hypothetical protein
VRRSQKTPASRARTAIAAWLALCGGSAAAHEIEFASAEAARAVLGTRDAFVARLSPFDRAGRLESASDVSEAEFLAFVAQAPREWSRAERERVAAAFASIRPKLTDLLPALEAPILIIKTTGAEEGDTGYTRGGAVVLPESAVAANSRTDLRRLLAHEIFHIVSRARPELRNALYETIGFHRCGEVELPTELAVRKMTNPDAPVNEHCIRLRVDDAEVWGMPVLLARQARYDRAAGRKFFDYLTFPLLLVERDGAAGSARILERDGAPKLVPIEQVSGYFEQVGRNTQYIIHAEEILASNFAQLALGETRVPSPEVHERMRSVLAAAP